MRQVNLYTKDNLLTVFLILKWVVSNQKLFQQNSFKKCFLVSVQYQMCWWEKNMANKIKIQWSKFSLTYSWECNRLAMHIIAPLSTLKSNLFAMKQFGRPSGILFCLSMALRSSILRWQICLMNFPLQCLWGTFLKRTKNPLFKVF